MKHYDGFMFLKLKWEPSNIWYQAINYQTTNFPNDWGEHCDADKDLTCARDIGLVDGTGVEESPHCIPSHFCQGNTLFSKKYINITANDVLLTENNSSSYSIEAFTYEEYLEATQGENVEG